MSDRGMMFDAESVRAILSGTKTQTRRVLKPQPRQEDLVGNTSGEVSRQWVLGRGCWELDDVPDPERLPYRGAERGDRIWVRETYGKVTGNGIRTVYRADGPVFDSHYGNELAMKWASPLWMPRKWSRITLEVTAVRIARVQAITEADARAEGVATREAFASRWDGINAKRGFPWADSPWVVAITFRRLTPAADTPRSTTPAEPERTPSR